MAEIFSTLGSVINLGSIISVLAAVGLVFVCAWLYTRKGKKHKKRPGQYMLYECPGKTSAEVRGLLNKQSPADIFSYTLETTRGGGWYITLTKHNPTDQILETVYLLQFEGENPALLSLTFVREAFGMREPVVGEALVDEFFTSKLGAVRTQEQPS